MSSSAALTMSGQYDYVESALQPPREKWLFCFTLMLAGYGIFGKGFAYVGAPPVYIGEVMLAFGLVRLAFARGWWRILTMRPMWWLLAMMVWGGVCTVPHLAEYQVDALRDSVAWGYALWALVIGGLVISQPRLLRLLVVTRYRPFAKIFLIAIPGLWCVQYFLPDLRPVWPNSEIPMFHLKAGDVLVHVGGIVACFIVNLGRPVSRWWLLPLCVTAMLGGVVARSGLISMMAAFTIATLLVPRNRISIPLIAIGMFSLVLLMVSDLDIQMPTSRRTVSSEQLLANLLSVVGVEGEDARGTQLEGTKDWRIAWWTTIYEYTVHGSHFWTGKGFGVNLADDDGFQIAADGSVRSPHSIHMTMLARAGVPGFLLWMLVQITWCGSIVQAYRHARLSNRGGWQRLFAFLLAYWCAFLLNASFDVYLEGPVGGVWFWSLIGLGMGSVWVYQQPIPVPFLDKHDAVPNTADPAEAAVHARGRL